MHIKTNLPDKPLTEITALDIQQTLNKIKSSRMRQNSFTILNEAIRRAYIIDLIPKNIMEAVIYQKHKQTPRKAFTVAEQNCFIEEALKSDIGKIFVFQIYTGSRPGEAQRMKWSFIDEEKNTCFIDGTKNIYAKRKIPMFHKLKNLLEMIPKTDERIFPFSPKVIRDEFNRLMKICQLNDFDQYCCRHTFGTRLSEAGIDIKTIACWMGHNGTETTGKIYIESQDEHQQSLTPKLDELF